MLKIKNVWFRYLKSQEWVLKNINIFFSSKGLYLVSGPSGSGKSTLAKIIVGIIPLIYKGELRGDVELFGKSIFKDKERIYLHHIGYLGQQPELYAFASTAKRELIDILELVTDNVEELLSKLQRISSKFKLEELLDRPLTELSAGQLQRIEIAAIVAKDPKILVLDEPLSRLDPYYKIEMANLIKELSKERLVIVFEHDLEHILPLSNYCIVLNNGEVIAEGRPRETISYLKEVDLPSITEVFLAIERIIGKRISYPLTLEEAMNLLEEMYGND